jgi:hypothetical protein
MLSVFWFSGKARAPCYLWLGFRAKRDLHAVYGLIFGRSAVFITRIK